MRCCIASDNCQVGGELRPGIVHRLDKETSGLIVVAKNDVAHRKLAQQFSGREVKKRYLALVQGWPRKIQGTINAAIGRDAIRRIRMTTRGSGGRTAVTHYEVQRRIDSPYGKFALLDVRIETGRTHQIRVHLSSIGHPVVGDTLYGAAAELRRPTAKARAGGRSGASPQPATSDAKQPPVLSLDRNFLHAAAIEFAHPRTGAPLNFTPRRCRPSCSNFWIRLPASRYNDCCNAHETLVNRGPVGGFAVGTGRPEPARAVAVCAIGQQISAKT